jgi:hypothetical protein
MWDETDLAKSLEGEEGATTTFPLSGAWWALGFILLIMWEDCIGECVGAAWTIGLTGGGGVGREKLANQDVGRLSGGQSLSIYYFQGL